MVRLSHELLPVSHKGAYEKYSYIDMSGKIFNEYVGIGPFRKVGNDVMMTLRHPGMEWSLVTLHDGKARAHRYYPESESTIINGIMPESDPRWITTLVSGDSPDSFLFIMQSADNDDSNPAILDAKGLK